MAFKVINEKKTFLSNGHCSEKAIIIIFFYLNLIGLLSL